MSRRTMEREARRQYVIDAARGLLAAQGIENTSMEDIAEAVEYTRRTLYEYFKSRDEILLSVLIADMTARWGEQQEALARAGTGLEKILAWGESFYAFAVRNPHSMRLHFYWDFRGLDREKIDEEHFRAFERINDELAEGLRSIFRLGVRDGSVRRFAAIDSCTRKA